MLARPASRVNARFAAQCGHTQATIFTQKPFTECDRDMRRLQPGILVEGRAGLFDLGCVRERAEIAQFETDIAKQFDEFAQLLFVADTQNQSRHDVTMGSK